MLTAILSLAGGQGKTTTALFLGKAIAQAGGSLLYIDADPLHSLTLYTGLELETHQPTFMDVLRGNVTADDAIYPIETHEHLYLLPASHDLVEAESYLSQSTTAPEVVLKRRLEAILARTSIVLIDTPPQRSRLNEAVLGIVSSVIIPAEASAKGYGSLIATLDFLEELQKKYRSVAEVVGVVPFRDRWIGSKQSQESRLAIECMQGEVGEALVLPSIRESEVVKQAINQRQSLSQMHRKDLEQPFRVLMDAIQTHSLEG
jgi:chromosome partitioning protein